MHGTVDRTVKLDMSAQYRTGDTPIWWRESKNRGIANSHRGVTFSG